MGKLYVVGIGPGGLEHMTLKAREVIKESEIIVGYTKYIKLIEPLIEGKEVFATGMKAEVERCKKALELSKDKTVSIVSTGDAGIYGMAGLIYELRDKEEVEVIPGLTASTAAASCLGSPLMHDNCTISLSDLMTPYEKIKMRVEFAAKADFVISLYNPRSNGRPDYLKECLEIVKKYRSEDTPVGLVKNALREGQNVKLDTLADFDYTEADMLSIVIIGNSQSYIKDNKMITPRGYNIK